MHFCVRDFGLRDNKDGVHSWTPPEVEIFFTVKMLKGDFAFPILISVEQSLLQSL